MRMAMVFLMCAWEAGCTRTAPSRPAWGELAGGGPTFLSATTLHICGSAELRAVANDAIWEWNNARGRHHQLKSTDSCAGRRDADASLNVTLTDCPMSVVGNHSQEGNHHDVGICRGVGRSLWMRIMLHELGHAYGLCDQYTPGNASRIAFHPNCGRKRSVAPAISVMGGLYDGSPGALTADDITGIRTLHEEIFPPTPVPLPSAVAIPPGSITTQ